MPTIIKNGRNYSGTSVSLTQAEYDALPEVTKMNGTTYFITDSDVVLDADNVALGNGTVEDLAGSVAVIETETASANRSIGDHILLNGQLYTITSPVATGETYAVGTNIEAKSIGEELTALNNSLVTLGDEISCIIPLSSTGWIIGSISTPTKSGYTLVGYLLRTNTYRVVSMSYQISGATTNINAYVNSVAATPGNVFCLPIFKKNA